MLKVLHGDLENGCGCLFFWAGGKATCTEAKGAHASALHLKQFAKLFEVALQPKGVAFLLLAQRCICLRIGVVGYSSGYLAVCVAFEQHLVAQPDANFHLRLLRFKAQHALVLFSRRGKQLKALEMPYKIQSHPFYFYTRKYYAAIIALELRRFFCACAGFLSHPSTRIIYNILPKLNQHFFHSLQLLNAVFDGQNLFFQHRYLAFNR